MALNFGVKASKNSAEKQIIAKITGWVKAKVKEALPGGHAQPIVMVTELQCFDPDCVPIETLIVILGNGAKWSDKILRPSAEVTKEDVELIEIPGEVLGLPSAVSSTASFAVPPTPSSPPAAAATATAADCQQAATVVKMKFFTPSSYEPVRQSDAGRTHTTSSGDGKSGDTQFSGFVTASSSGPISSCAPPPPLPPPNPTTTTATTTVVPMCITTDAVPVLAASKQQPLISQPPTITTARSTTSSSSSSSGSNNSSNTSRARNTAKRAAQQAVLSADSASVLGSSSGSGRGGQRSKHQEGSRPRGCPCCDPDNLDNIIDMMGGMI